MKLIPLSLVASLLMTANIHAADLPSPPAPDAEKKPHEVKAPNRAVGNDKYYLLRDDKRQDRAVIAYLNAENAYTSQVMAPLKPLEDKLYEEIVARIKQDDGSVPYRERGWWYYSRFETGQDYPIHARRKDRDGADAQSMLAASQKPDADEEILLDVNALAKGKDYY